MRIRIHFHLQDVKSDLPQTSALCWMDTEPAEGHPLGVMSANFEKSLETSLE